MGKGNDWGSFLQTDPLGGDLLVAPSVFGKQLLAVDDATGAIDLILPAQTGNDGKVLTTNGSAVSWESVDAVGGGSFSSITGDPTDNAALSSALAGKVTGAESNAVLTEIDVAAHATGGTGTSGNPWTGWSTAITWATGNDYRFRKGYFNFSTTIALPFSNYRLRGAGRGNSFLIFTGTGNAITSINTGTSPFPGAILQEWDGFTIRGSSTATDLVVLQAVSHSQFRNIDLADCTSRLFWVKGGICNTYDNLRGSNTTRAWASGATPQYGLVFDHRASDGLACTASPVINAIIEGVSLNGIDVIYGYNMHFSGGTSENNGSTGIKIRSTSSFCHINTMDNESNVDRDFQIEGDYNTLTSCLSAPGVLNGAGATEITGHNNLVSGGLFYSFNLTAGAVNNTLTDISAANSYTDSGTATIRITSGQIGIGRVPAVTLDLQTATNTWTRLKRGTSAYDAAYLVEPEGTVSSSHPQWGFGVHAGGYGFSLYSYDGASIADRLTFDTSGNMSAPPLSSPSTWISNLGLGALATVTPGTGVATALALNVGSAGAFVVNGGALGTPSSGSATNLTGITKPLAPTAVKTANYAAAANELVVCDTTSGTFTVTFPTAPADGTRIGVKMVTQGAANLVNLALGGSDVFNKTGGVTTGSLTLVNQAVVAQYKASGAIWYVTSTDIPLSQMDLRYGQLGAGNSWGTVNVFTAGLTSGVPINAASGGTGIASYAVGDLLYASGATTLSKLADVATGSVLVSGGVTTAPAWSATPTLNTLTLASTTSLLLGTAGSAVGNIGFRNATSGTATLAPPTGALGTYTVTLPSSAGTLALSGANSDITSLALTGATTQTYAGTASTPALKLSGAPYTGGSTTTNKPQLLLENASTSTGWNANGTWLGINRASAFTGDFIRCQQEGAGILFVVNSTGGVTMGASTCTNTFQANNLQVLNTGSLTFSDGSNFSGGFMRANSAIEVNTGTAISGTSNAYPIRALTFIPAGTATTCTGGTIGSGSKSNAGFVTATTTGTSTIVITFPVTAPTGWTVIGVNLTTGTGLFQTAKSTTTATLTGATTGGDIVQYLAMAY